MAMNRPTTSRGSAQSQRRIAILFKLTVSLTILLSILLLSGIYHVGSNATLAGGLFGAVFIFLACRPSPAHLGWSLAAGVGVALIYGMLGGSFGKDSGVETFSFFMGIGAFLGAGSILFMSLHRVWTGAPKYSAGLRDAVIAPAFILTAGLSMQLANRGLHASYDYFLYRFDLSLGLTPGHSIISLFRTLPWIRIASFLTYSGLLLFPPLYHGWAIYKGKAAKIHLVHAFVIAGIVGFVFYHICPAVGPLVTFGQQFPDHLPVMSAVPGKTFMSASVYNAMPSLHMTWALLVWIAAWELGSLAVVMASFIVMFTGFATVGFGEHYFIDLIVAVPLAMAVYGICTARYKLTAVGLASVSAWTIYLRTGFQLSTPLHWLSVMGTIMVAVYMMRSFLTTNRKGPAPSVDPASEPVYISSLDSRVDPGPV